MMHRNHGSEPSHVHVMATRYQNNKFRLMSASKRRQSWAFFVPHPDFSHISLRITLWPNKTDHNSQIKMASSLCLLSGLVVLGTTTELTAVLSKAHSKTIRDGNQAPSQSNTGVSSLGDIRNNRYFTDFCGTG